MKIVSWNIRGLGGLEKRKEVLCLMSSLFVLRLGRRGGLLTIWDPSEVVMRSTKSRDHVLWCHGRFLKTGEDFSVANVYAPCDDIAKQQLFIDAYTGGRDGEGVHLWGL
ncbi:endonuclease/exonuclease/phosphatase family protein [Trifolium pratense]|uniref:Endonuclease/exonuclease/phosphatase family protein n=1 Tax=Trifolium pratense TaxID=57577 RepID=A0A2K3KRP2_TRIPR|nr:endonuclease/exonuclease/phosphatase family protein [Trifolium pratense]